jgi:hypothetical protein
MAEPGLQRFKFSAPNAARFIDWEKPTRDQTIDTHSRQAATPGSFSLRNKLGYGKSVTHDAKHNRAMSNIYGVAMPINSDEGVIYWHMRTIL